MLWPWGRKPIIDREIEESFCEYVEEMELFGIFKEKAILSQDIIHYMKTNKIDNDFKNGKPSKFYYNLFISNFPETNIL